MTNLFFSKTMDTDAAQFSPQREHLQQCSIEVNEEPMITNEERQEDHKDKDAETLNSKEEQELKQYFQEIDEKLLTIDVQISKQFYDSPTNSEIHIYPTHSQNRGIFLCINNINFIDENMTRKGAEIDDKNLTELFKQMGFRIKDYRNQSLSETMRIIRELIDNGEELKEMDCIVVAVMSHGKSGPAKENTLIVTSDLQYISTSWIIDQFDHDNCKALIGKPKIFIFQMCRWEGRIQHENICHMAGDGLSKNVLQQIKTDARLSQESEIFGRSQGPREVPVRNVEDMLIGFSTLPGCVSYRHTLEGTWYIQAICKTFMDKAHNMDIESLLKLVNKGLRAVCENEKLSQTASYENRDFKVCYLHPGIYKGQRDRLRYLDELPQ